MDIQEYERRAKAIDAWANAQYGMVENKFDEAAIELCVERMFDALDDEYMPGRHVPDLYQTINDV